MLRKERFQLYLHTIFYLLYIYTFIDGCESFLPYGDERLVKARYYSEQSWYYICEDGFTEETANVICRENGYTKGVENITSFERTAEDYFIYPRQHNCIGDENSLCDCPETNLTCGNYAVMVECTRQGNYDIPKIRCVYLLTEIFTIINVPISL